MKTKTEIDHEAVRLCPYAHYYQGHVPWVEGYKVAAQTYEAQVEQLRKLLRKSEDRFKALNQELFNLKHGK